MANKVYRDEYSLEIYKSKWLRGNDSKSKSAMLVPETGKMCCLGFYAKRCGIPEKLIAGTMSPSQLTHNLDPLKRRWDTFLLSETSKNDKINIKSDSIDAIALMRINDDPKTDDAYKEKEIKRIFMKHSIPVYFYN